MRLRCGALLTPMVVVTLMCVALPALAQGTEQPQTVSLVVKDASLQHTLELLFRDSGRQFQIEGGVGGSVTADLSNVSWEQALRLILDSQNLTYEVRDNVYRVKPKAARLLGDAPAPPPPPAGGKREGSGFPTSTPRTGAGGMEKLELIKVRYADPAMLAAMFGGPSVGYAYSGYSGYGGYSGMGGMGGMRGAGVLGMPQGYMGIPSYGGGYSAGVPTWGQGSWIGGAITSRISRTSPGE